MPQENADNAAQALATALGLEQDGKQDEALASYAEALDAGIEDVLLYSNQGMLLERLRRYEEALASFQKAAQLESNFRDHYNAGNMRLILEQPAQAIESYDASIACRDDYPECWVNKAIAHHALQQTEPARAALEKALELKPQFYPALRSMAILLSDLGKEAEALGFYQKAAEAMPESAAAWFELACALYKTLGDEVTFQPDGPEGMTMQALDKTLELDPDKQGAWGRKIGVLFRLADAALSHDQSQAEKDPAVPRMLPLIHSELLSTIEAACQRFPQDEWFVARKEDAKELAPDD